MKIMKYLTLIALMAAGLLLNAQPKGFLWAKGIGGSNDDSGNSIALDGNDNVYTTGYFRYIADFDPGPGTYNLNSAGYYDIFISKLDASGNFVWAKQIGGISDDNGQSIVLDENSNVFITGYFNNTVDFDPGIGTHVLTTTGSRDMFILKLDSSGNFVWVRQIGGISGEIGSSITLDESGNIYTTGEFLETIDFDPGPETYNLTSAGLSDIYVLKLDGSGNFVWAASMGGDNWDYGSSIFVDGDGYVYTTGSFKETADFDPGSDTYFLTGIYDYDEIFISKLDASGNFVWAGHMGGEGNDNGQSIVVDMEGTVYTTGHFEGTADFDPGPGQYNLTPVGEYDIYISKIDASGNFVWAKQKGGASYDYAYSIALDNDGNVYTTGAGIISTAMSYDIIFTKLDATGNFIWMEHTGGWSAERGYSMVLDDEDNIYIAGYFNETCDFNPGNGTSNLTSVGSEDIFILKLTQFDPIGIEEQGYHSGIQLITFDNRIAVSGMKVTALVEVYDMAGKSIGQWQVSPGINEFILNAHPGIYLVRISGDNLNFMEKIYLK